MIQNILVLAIILIALAWSGRQFYLTVKGKKSACDSCIKPTAGSCNPNKAASHSKDAPYSPPDIF